MFKTHLAIALALAATSAPAFASDRDQPPTRTVFYADLNLASDAGVAELDRRIRLAVREVCQDPSPRYLFEFFEERRCRTRTLASVAQRRSVAIAAARDRNARAMASR